MYKTYALPFFRPRTWNGGNVLQGRMKIRVNRLSKRPPFSFWFFMTVPLWYGQWDWECHPIMFQTCYFFIARKHCFSSEATLSQLWCSPLQAILAKIQQPTCLTLAYPHRSLLQSCRMRPDVYGWVWCSRSFCLTMENNIKRVMAEDVSYFRQASQCSVCDARPA